MKQLGDVTENEEKDKIGPKTLTMSGVWDNMGGKLPELENRHGQDRQTLP